MADLIDYLEELLALFGRPEAPAIVCIIQEDLADAPPAVPEQQILPAPVAYEVE